MKVTVSGEVKEYKDEITLAELITEENVQTPEYVTVSVNDELLGAGAFEETVLKDGDTLEFLYFMGGGCCHGLFQ
ncbi:sulfur carrier protein ThiS [Aminipila butyrica]|uniref:Sulfur carrier protein ThiS n=1 Tax=Aminipila butyrica TaxID=433296 RepID=A0A858BSH1_9FIRM|nr:sulfur carrier protein ThiS [Aminipila butyrica]QIB68018.1 sulfur carrier protein ThiS [Aminipila butyrica]